MRIVSKQLALFADTKQISCQSKIQNLKSKIELHSFVVRTAAAFGRDPINDLIRVHYVAGFAVNTVGKIDFQFAPVGFRVVFHFVNRRRTETLTRIAVFFGAARRADVRVENVQMRRLIFVMRDSGVINVGNFVES